jgi:phage baseplate assembly protein W
MAYKNLELNPSQNSLQHRTKQSQFYVGYSSVNADVEGTTKLYDFDIIKQDIINQFNTRKGERVMNPTFGTIVWDMIFDPFTQDVKQAIADDVSRICNSDPRAVAIQLNIDEQEFGMLLEATLQYVGTDQTSNMRLAFDKKLGLIPQ